MLRSAEKVLRTKASVRAKIKRNFIMSFPFDGVSRRMLLIIWSDEKIPAYGSGKGPSKTWPLWFVPRK